MRRARHYADGRLGLYYVSNHRGGWKCPDLKFSAPALRSLRLCGEVFKLIFTAETQRTLRLRREKAKSAQYLEDLA